jgi:hypothetical protein
MSESPDDAVSFSELRERVGTRDSGHFNYHLGQLAGSFVAKGPDGYSLTYAGSQIVGAMHAGTYTANATIDPIELSEDCPICGGRIHVQYEEETAVMACQDCDEWYNEFGFPPGSLDQFSREELPVAFDRWMRQVVGGVVAGFCTSCAGRVDGRLVAEGEFEALNRAPAHAAFVCRRCGSRLTCSAATPPTFHPAVIGFIYDHGFDVSREPSWQTWGGIGKPETTLVSDDPLQVDVRFEADGDAIVVTVDADASVADIRYE